METPTQPLIQIELKARWGDMDMLGHLNNTLYFRYFEQARMEWLNSVPEIQAELTERGPVIVDAHATFLRPVIYPATVLVSMHGGAPGRSSFDSHYQIHDAADPSILYSEGRSKMVWVNYVPNRSTPLPDAVVALLPKRPS